MMESSLRNDGNQFHKIFQKSMTCVHFSLFLPQNIFRYVFIWHEIEWPYDMFNVLLSRNNDWSKFNKIRTLGHKSVASNSFGIDLIFDHLFLELFQMFNPLSM